MLLDKLTIRTDDKEPPVMVEITEGQKKLYAKIVPAFLAVALSVSDGRIEIPKALLDDLENFDFEIAQGFDATTGRVILQVNGTPKQKVITPPEKELIIPNARS